VNTADYRLVMDR